MNDTLCAGLPNFRNGTGRNDSAKYHTTILRDGTQLTSYYTLQQFTG